MPALKSKIACWFKPVLIGVAALFFLLLGVDTLRFAYTLKHPVEFLLCFFASNLIILISGVGCLYAVFAIRKAKQEEHHLRP